MTRKEQNIILDAKIESNVNQYKVDRMNAEISAFSSGDLNKYEFLKRIDLNYKPNALDKARFEFSPLGKTFSTGLDKNGYQEEGVIKLLKDIRDGLRGVNTRPNNNRRDDEFDNMSDDVSFDDNDNDNGSFDDDGSFHNNDNDNDSFDDDNGSDLNKKYNSLLRTHFQLRKNMNDTSKELDKTKDELDKTKDELDKTKDELDKTKDELYDSHDFNIDDKHKDTNDIYNPNGFDINGLHKDTNDIYNPNGFDRYYTHKDTNNIYDPNGFSIDGFNKYTKTIYDPNWFDINGFYKDTRSKYDSNGFDINGKHKARSFEDQRGKGYVDLPILLSKIYTNNTVEPNSNELVSNVKQLINDLYDNKQITKQVYNNLIKAITYK